MAEKAGVQSLERAFCLLEELSMHPGGIHLLELSRLTGLHKSTAHRMLASLIALGYVQKSEDAEGKYHLSFKLFEMAGRIVEQVDVLEVARGALEQLRNTVQEAVHLVVRDGESIVYVYKLENTGNTYQMFSRIGMRRPMYCTAAGKAILSTLSDREVARIWEASEILQQTPHTITDMNSLYSELDNIREKGYALDNEENEMGVRCIAGVIKDYSGQSRAAFSVSAPMTRMDDARIAVLSREVLETAAKISARLGYHEEKR